STLEKADWNNTTIISGDPATAVAELKQHDGQPLVMYGHGPLGQTLLEHQLLDELHFMIHPVFVGRGTLLFRETGKTPLRLAGTTPPNRGAVPPPHHPAGSCSAPPAVKLEHAQRRAGSSPRWGCGGRW